MVVFWREDMVPLKKTKKTPKITENDGVARECTFKEKRLDCYSCKGQEKLNKNPCKLLIWSSPSYIIYIDKV